MATATRAQVIAEAERFLGLRWVHQGRSAIHGIDCIGLPVLVALNLGLIREAPPANYPPRPDGTLLRLFRESPAIEILPTDVRPGDILVFINRNTTAQCHCGILTEHHGQPGVIHTYIGARKVVKETLASATHSVGVWTHAFKFPNLED